MAVTTSHEPTRRHLTAPQADKVDRLVDAAQVELRTHGYEGLTVRNAARRAGVAPATAYTYFASKDHLITEVFWRRVQALPEVSVDGRRTPVARVVAALRDVALLVADEPELATACTTAVLANDADVRRLRDRIGAAVSQRLADALGEDGEPATLRALGLACSGAMLQAGMGYFAYAEIADRMEEVARLVFERRG
jgi:AcrR family transcriptional regulator